MQWILRHINQRLLNCCLLGIIMLAVSGCLSISSEADPVQLYRLTAADITTADAAPIALEISINSSRLLDSQRLWVMQADRRVQPMADLRWAMPAPELLRQTLIETLESAGVAVAVPAAAGAERLRLELRALQIEISSGGQAQARISVLATMSAGAEGQVNQLFDVREPATINSPDSAAAAVDQASQELLTALVGWLQDQSRK